MNRCAVMTSSQPPNTTEQTRSDGEDLCPNCMTPNQSHAHFCFKCNAPLTPHAATDPIARIAATAFVYRKASARPQRRLVLIGMWLIFAPLFIINLPTFWFSFRFLISPAYRMSGLSASNYFFPSALGFFIITFGFEALFVLILIKVTRNYWRDLQYRNAE